jgi:hypothetical protein
VYARPFIDAIAGVQPHPIPGDAGQGAVDGVDVTARGGQLLRRRAGAVAELIGQERVVDLQGEPRVDDGRVLGVQGVGDRDRPARVLVSWSGGTRNPLTWG